ncbi:dihydropteroate synthase [Metabacillus idriensis]|uniref:Dihydropteroate synthase n=1 Tax=Metabacillus idriensis TaxID=324768 RepID=A0A6I2MGM2_9BACI|nr:dihydropteroate synthase [Metabacillus idriensis]MCM3598917.1 dihydropteroate synthase [Metabacillus idriensis]MRX56939.1 dihydropteroate synthase [Metabacillus idriensis]OHR64198.1 dihydropteroate synthase [Bacillus sp. HMSC76G11]
MDTILLDNKRELSCGPYRLNLSEKTFIMGILNLTPDSFSDGGRFNHIDAALAHAEEMIADGADIIDVGGESTRPGAEYVDAAEEIKRVVPIIEKLSKAINVPISIDTYKADVAEQAILAGATIINDVWGAKADPNMAAVAAKYNVPIVLMHNRQERNYGSLISDMIADLNESVEIVKRAGVQDDKIILDPGIGFAKTMEDNLVVMRNLETFSQLGYPVLLGTSRKTFIGRILDLPPSDRMEGTGATVCLGIEKGCSIVRVHDVQSIARMAKMMDAMLGKGAAVHG